jgi:DNA-binding response OmpR family regulator
MRLLIIEDDPRLSDALAAALRRRDFIVDCVGNLADARHALKIAQYRALVLDRRLPDGDGIELVPDVRRLVPRPGVLMLTARSTPSEVVAGLDAGSDDYLAKPFEVEVLVARLRALLRRPAPPVETLHRIGRITFDSATRQVTIADQPTALPRRELALLEVLILRPRSVATFDRIANSLYGIDDDVQPNAIQPHISRLRMKLRNAGAGVSIVGLRGIGYLIRETS